MKKLWNIAKSISLVMGGFGILCLCLGWQPIAQVKADAYAVEEPAIVQVDTYNAEEGTTAQIVSVPYTSIYDITISDAQMLAVLDYVDPTIVHFADEDLENPTPNEFILRCAYYNAAEVEDALNVVLGVTLAADWRTDECYIPENAASMTVNQAMYSSNGESYNAYGDVVE